MKNSELLALDDGRARIQNQKSFICELRRRLREVNPSIRRDSTEIFPDVALSDRQLRTLGESNTFLLLKHLKSIEQSVSSFPDLYGKFLKLWPLLPKLTPIPREALPITVYRKDLTDVQLRFGISNGELPQVLQMRRSGKRTPSEAYLYDDYKPLPQHLGWQVVAMFGCDISRVESLGRLLSNFSSPSKIDNLLAALGTDFKQATDKDYYCPLSFSEANLQDLDTARNYVSICRSLGIQKTVFFGYLKNGFIAKHRWPLCRQLGIETQVKQLAAQLSTIRNRESLEKIYSVTEQVLETLEPALMAKEREIIAANLESIIRALEGVTDEN